MSMDTKMGMAWCEHKIFVMNASMMTTKRMSMCLPCHNAATTIRSLCRLALIRTARNRKTIVPLSS